MYCDHCKESFQPDDSIIEHIGLPGIRLKDHTVYRAKGCDNCFQTGYRGRIGVFEIMVLTEELKGLILKTFDSNQIKQAARDQDMITLHADGIQKVLQGQTTFEEVLRVTAK